MIHFFETNLLLFTATVIGILWESIKGLPEVETKSIFPKFDIPSAYHLQDESSMRSIPNPIVGMIVVLLSSNRTYVYTGIKWELLQVADPRFSSL